MTIRVARGSRAISNFEFVFSLLVIVLGLGLSQLFGGVASAVKRRPRLELGWGTGLLATWVTTETVIFWEIVWRTRDTLPDSSQSLFGGLLVTALYYFAAALVFPDDLDERQSLDDYFMAEKGRVIAAVLAAVLLAFVMRAGVMGMKGWTLIPWYAWTSLAIIYVVGPIAALTKSRKLAIGCLALLVVVDLLDPVESIIWP
jgi:hypothetical protein